MIILFFIATLFATMTIAAAIMLATPQTERLPVRRRYSK